MKCGVPAGPGIHDTGHRQSLIREGNGIWKTEAN